MLGMGGSLQEHCGKSRGAAASGHQSIMLAAAHQAAHVHGHHMASSQFIIHEFNNVVNVYDVSSLPEYKFYRGRD